MVAIFIVIIAIIILILIFKKSNKKSIDTNIELEETTSSKVHFSNSFKNKESVNAIEKKHLITTIYQEEKQDSIWICPNCEVENLPSQKKCYVCHYKK